MDGFGEVIFVVDLIELYFKYVLKVVDDDLVVFLLDGLVCFG